MMDGWKSYNNALLPTTPPHKEPNLKVLKHPRIWSENRILLVRYTTDFDCGKETQWWWLIKDDEINIAIMKKKRRYEILSGLNNYEVRKISPKDQAEKVYEVYEAAFRSYKRAGKVVAKEKFITECISHANDAHIEYYGAFDKETGELAGYAYNHVFDDYVNFTTMKFVPKCLTKKVAAALIYTMLCEYLNAQKKKYVSDGERSVRHDTNFPDYLIKYFGFRKAYCQLHVKYRPLVGIAIKMLYPFRKIIERFNKYTTINNLSAVLRIETIRRST